MDLQSKTGIFNTTLSFNQFWNTKVLSLETRFNGVCSRHNLPDKINDGAYVINLDEYSDIGIHWIALYALHNNVSYFDSFGVEDIPKEIDIIINKSIVYW